MPQQPLVSIIMPCFNSTQTLPMAIASLLAQTYQNWECIFVDDGSQDNPQIIFEIIADPRIRLFKMPYNQGRGAARQTALDNANGDYLCMLDADDWYYPDKLEKQLLFMESHKNIALLSNSMAIPDRNNDITSIRFSDSSKNIRVKKFNGKTNEILFPYPTSIIRMSVARRSQFSAYLRQAEDIDWLFKILPGEYYAVSPEVNYAYSEYMTTTKQKTLSAYVYNIKMLWLNRSHSKIKTYNKILLTLMKLTLYQFAFAVGFVDYLIRHRRGTKTPEKSDITLFNSARSKVIHKLDKYPCRSLAL